MIKRSRPSRWAAAVVLVIASSAVAFAAVQVARRGAVKDTSSTVVATVNGEKITRGEILDKVLADEAARLAATDASMQERLKQQRTAASILVGSVVLKKMAANGWKPVTVSREEIMDFAFKDKSPVVVSAVDMAVTLKAVSQEGKKQGSVPTPAEIAARTTTSLNMARQQVPSVAGKPDAAVFKELGVRPQYLKPLITHDLTLEKLVKKEMEAKLGHPLGPNDFRAASHILISVKPNQPSPTDPANGTAPPKPADNEKAWADAKTKIDGILADIRSGKITFEQAAQQNSDDGSKFQGGSLGVFPRGQMVPEFEKAAFSQEKGKVGDPIRTSFGWHIVRVDKLGTELTAKERDEVMQRMLQPRKQAKTQEIMGKAKIDNKIKPVAPQPNMGFPEGGPGR